MRRFVRAVAVVAMVVAAAVAVPSAAHAVEPLPPPVLDYPDTPSRVVLYNGTMPPPGSEAYEEASARARKLLQAQGFSEQEWRAKTGQPAAKPAPAKPITRLAPLARGAGAAGAVLTGANFGWALGQGGLALVAAVSDQDYADIICNTPDWYQSGNEMFMMGAAPDCTVTVLEPNVDLDFQVSTVTFRGYTFEFVKMVTAPQWDFDSACFRTTGVRPSGVKGEFESQDGQLREINAPFHTGAQVQCGTGLWAQRVYKPGGPPGDAVAPGLRFYDDVTKQELGRSILTSPDPHRSLGCSIDWEDGTTTTGSGASYRESEGLPMSPSGFGCESAWASKAGAGPQLMPSRITVKSLNGTQNTVISDQLVPQHSSADRAVLEPGVSNRGLVLTKVVAGTALSCMTWEADCSQWWAATAEGTAAETATGTYDCTYAGRSIALAECGVYRQTFDVKTSTPTITDPLTDTQVQWGTRPGNQNSTDPGTGPTPGDQCLGEWPSQPNPIAWVAHPVKCALVWAFVPRAHVATAAQTSMMTAWAPTIVGQLPVIVGEVLTVPDGGSGCRGPHVVIPIKLPDYGIDTGYDGYPLSACEAPYSVLATWARVIGAAVLIWLTGLGIIRRASAIVNAPGVG